MKKIIFLTIIFSFLAGIALAGTPSVTSLPGSIDSNNLYCNGRLNSLNGESSVLFWCAFYKPGNLSGGTNLYQPGGSLSTPTAGETMTAPGDIKGYVPLSELKKAYPNEAKYCYRVVAKSQVSPFPAMIAYEEYCYDVPKATIIRSANDSVLITVKPKPVRMAIDTVAITVKPKDVNISDTVEITVDPGNASISDLAVGENYCSVSPSLSFGWKFNGNSPGDYQKSYQLLVATDPSLADPVIDAAGTNLSSYSVLLGAKLQYSGAYYWKVIIKDQNNDVYESDVQTYAVKSKHPIVDFSWTSAYKDSKKVYTFKDLSTPQDDIISRTWNFGDGTASKALEPSHTYSTTNKYSVTLTVVDKNNNSCSKTKQLDARNNPTYQEVLPWDY